MPEIIVKSVLIGFVCLLVYPSAFAQQKRDLLTSDFSRKFVENSLRTDESWINYPSYGERTAWEALPTQTRTKTITAGEAYPGYDWPIVKATMYLEFAGDGFLMEAHYDSKKLEATIESIPLEVPRLIQNHGKQLSRIVLLWKEDVLKGDLKMELIPRRN